jgi:two-component system, chemotaxis family, sensor kinase CheA
MSEQEKINLIFYPGFTTKEEVSAISGRGVGMDVVKSNIEILPGEVIVETDLDKGSTFRLVLPLTLAILDAMIVHQGGQRFAIPLAQIHEFFAPSNEQLQKYSCLGEVMMLRGENIPTYRLKYLLHKKGISKIQENEKMAIVVRTRTGAFAVLVDDIIGQQQIVTKKLGKELGQIKGITGSAILGDGKPALILELTEIL